MALARAAASADLMACPRPSCSFFSLAPPPAQSIARRRSENRALAQCALSAYAPSGPIQRQCTRRRRSDSLRASADTTTSGNGEVVDVGADNNAGGGARLTASDLDALAKKKAGRATSAVGRVADGLESVSIVVVGPSTDLNEAVSRALGKRLGWFSVSTRKVLLGLNKAEDEEGLKKALLARAAAGAAAPSSEASSTASTTPQQQLPEDLVGAAETEVLVGLSSQFRCCVATLGGRASAVGAAASGEQEQRAKRQDALRRQLAGSLVLWVEEIDKRAATPSASSSSSSSGSSGKRAPATGAAMVERATPAQRPYAALAEVRVALEVSTGGFGSASNLTAEQKAEKAATQIVTTLARVLEQDEDLGGRKRAYVEEVIIGREKLAAAAAARAEGLERAQAAMEETRRQQQEQQQGKE